MLWRRTSSTLIGADDWPRAERFCVVDCCPQARYRVKTIEMSPGGTVDFGWSSPTLGQPAIGSVRAWRTAASWFRRKQLFEFIGGWRPCMIRVKRKIDTTNPTTFAVTTTYDEVEFVFDTTGEIEVGWDASTNQDITVNAQSLYLAQ